MKLVPQDNETLRNKLDPFDLENSPVDLKELKESLVEKMFEENGIGLAANQLGYPYRVFVIRGARKEESVMFVNPEIVNQSEYTVNRQEGCLTGGLEDIYAMVNRPDWVTATWHDENKEQQKHTLKDMTARVFQHELDHLDGILFIDHCSKLKLDRAMEKRSKIKRRREKVSHVE